jgi:RimJ/RimL family protein N-acetyltransferase
MQNTIETERLLLRGLAKEDADFILELVNTPEWIEVLPKGWTVKVVKESGLCSN